MNCNLTEEQANPIHLEEADVIDGVLECDASIFAKILNLKEGFDRARVHDPGNKLLESIRNSRLGLLKWKREKLGNVQNAIKNKQNELDDLQQGLLTTDSKKKATILAKDIDRLREEDDMYWCQQSRAFWRVKGDRPIALYNTVAKVISKALAIRLKRILSYVISDTQSAFIPNRLITDNILMAYEAHHIIKSKKTGKEGFMSIKLDMLKAYD
ncbi:hypothetical protein LIER_06562 [Lithospermum erythrorhizon]|uniref:Reverse transcriptase domain-containing protein n=1 Tax=Lithospermum erythrorhizon TaxID=34254 RepID=A0AAV3P609_LITER